MSSPSFPVETIAKLFNLSSRRIQQLAKEKIIPKANRGKYDLIACVQAYIRYLQDTTDGKKETADVKLERGRLLKAQADKTELEVETMKGSLVSLEDLEMEWSSLVTIFRSKLLSIPSRGAVLTVSSKEVHAIENILRELIHEALTELSRYDPFSKAIENPREKDCEADCPSAESDSESVGGSI